MKVTDLMIGDLVQFDEDICIVEELRVDGTVVLVAMNTDLTSVDGDQVDVEELSPIELTEEILVKNGFVYREEEETCATQAFHHWQLNGHWFALNYTQYFRKEKKDDMPRFDIAGIAIHYVHQLQHLLRLCGIDKEIEL